MVPKGAASARICGCSKKNPQPSQRDLGDPLSPSHPDFFETSIWSPVYGGQTQGERGVQPSLDPKQSLALHLAIRWLDPLCYRESATSCAGLPGTS